MFQWIDRIGSKGQTRHRLGTARARCLDLPSRDQRGWVAGTRRRHRNDKAALAGLGGVLAPVLARRAVGQVADAGLPSRAALVKGNARADNILRSLRLIENQIRKGLARKKRVLLKPNLVWARQQLSSTHVDCLEAILEFLKPLVKDEIIIADSPAGGRVTEAYENYGYYRLAKKYNVKFLDLDAEPTAIRHVIDQRFHPRAVRMSKLVLDPDTYVISSAVMKTHDRVVATLSLKNVVVGAAIKGPKGPGGKKVSDKPIIHGGPANEGINYNLLSLAKELHPDLAVIDGFEGMEGNGPITGGAVDHKVAVASTDWLAADRIGVELMGFDFAKIGYLTFCARAGMGQADLAKIEVLGEKVADHIRPYRPADNIEQQYKWMSRG